MNKFAILALAVGLWLSAACSREEQQNQTGSVPTNAGLAAATVEPNATTPAGLSALAVSATQINVIWTDNSVDEITFVLERAVAGGQFQIIATPPANTTFWTDAGLIPSTTYAYRLMATDASSISTYSNIAIATTPSSQSPVIGPPPAPAPVVPPVNPPAPPPDPPVNPPVQPPAPTTDPYVVLAYNDTGMNVMNPDYSTFMIAPPNNTLRAVVIKRGNLPQIVTGGITVAYSVPGNTRSSDKINFWSHVQQLIGQSLPANTGISGNGLSGTMAYSGQGYWEAAGIPVTPTMDDGVHNPYPLATVTVTTSGNAMTVATTQVPLPVSTEMNCAACHSDVKVLTLHGAGGGHGMGGDCLSCHSAHGEGSNCTSCHSFGGSLSAADDDDDEDEDEGGGNGNAGGLSAPVYCGSCHPQPQLSALGAGSDSYPSLSQAIHGSHASRTTDCGSCHPSDNDLYQRDVHLDFGITCYDCHGEMSDLAASGRDPWSTQPRCSDCHAVTGHSYEQAGLLYKDSRGHGGVPCAACHGAPHAIGPSTVAAENAQAIARQGKPGVISRCAVCHLVPPGAFNHTY